MSRGGTRAACGSTLRAIAKALLSRGVGFQPLRVLICVGLIAGACATASAAPFVPQSDGQVLERLPFAPSDPVPRRLRALNGQLTRAPNDLPLAVVVAQGYSELGRVTGDPRYAGYAQAALAPWWSLERAPQEVLVLRAALHQRMHQFDLALADLATVLNINPRNVEARLMLATVKQVRGAYDEVREECRALQDLTEKLVWTACLANVNGATGRLRDSYERLRAAFSQYPIAGPKLGSWVLTSLAQDVVALLRDKIAADPLLLRYALALQAQNSNDLAIQVQQLVDRFAASRLRRDRVHLREEARFTLRLLNAPATALKLAQENWQVQKEPADVRILLEAALAVHDNTAVDEVKEWLGHSGLEGVQLQPMTAPRS